MFFQRPTRLILIRHAESVANAQKRIQGWGDDPLSARGIEQARHLAGWFQEHNPRPALLVSSTLQRAYQTAEMLSGALNLPIQTRAGLRELGLGQLEEVNEAYFVSALEEDDFEKKFQLEDIFIFGERVLGSLYGLLAMYEGRTIMVVTHGGVIGLAFAYWLDHDITMTWIKYGDTANTSISELAFGEGVEAVRFNELSHLE